MAPDAALRDLVAIRGEWGAITDIVHGLLLQLEAGDPPFEGIGDGKEYDRIKARLDSLLRWADDHRQAERD
jgi:hypothetical protein